MQSHRRCHWRWVLDGLHHARKTMFYVKLSFLDKKLQTAAFRELLTTCGRAHAVICVGKRSILIFIQERHRRRVR